MKRNRIIAVTAIAVLLPGLTLCTAPQKFKNLLASKTITSFSADTASGQTAAAEARRLNADLKRLQVFSRQLQEMTGNMRYLRKRAEGVVARGYYTPDEHDAIERLLFRYLMCRQALWEMVDRYREYQKTLSTPRNQVRGFIIGYNAALHLAYYSSKVVNTFSHYQPAIDKINEAYYRSGIPAGTFDSLYVSITKTEHLEAMEAAWILYSRELGDHTSLLYTLTREDPALRGLTRQVKSLYDQSQQQICQVMKKRALLLPKTENAIRQSAVMETVRKAFEEWQDNIEAARAVICEQVGDTEVPFGGRRLLAFSPDQVAAFRRLLKPGDIILTFSAGYLSNIFLPGKFKHGITYIGSPADRASLGLTDQLPNLGYAVLPDGKPADVIEAVSEGVIFNNLEELLRTHINRVVVLRPGLAPEHTRQQLLTAFGLVGNAYDFTFDFTDGSFNCCTEVIYRGLHARGPFDFPLTNRMGIMTLSAEDIVRYHLKNKGVFGLVVYAEPDPETEEYRARVLEGEEGQMRLVDLMKDK